MIRELIDGIASLAGPISHTLIHSLWQGGAIALFLTLAFLILRRSDARIRYGLACTGMIAIFVTTIGTGVYFVATDPGLDGGFACALIDGLTGDLVAEIADEASPTSTFASDPDELSPFVPAGTHAPAETAASTDFSDLLPPIEWVFPLWIVGVAILTLRHIVGWRRATALIRNGTTDLPAALAARMKRLCHDLAISRPVRFLTSAVVQVPCVVGCFKPVVLIPLSTLTGIPAADLELIIVHELAHIRRHDVLIGYLQVIAETLLFFNPAVWWISRQIRVEREHCCDDYAIAMGDRFRYIRALIDLDELRDKKGAFVMAANNTSLVHRVRRLIAPSPEPVTLPGAGVAGAFLLAAFLVLASSLTPDLTPTESVAAPDKDRTVDVRSDDSDIEGEWKLQINRENQAQLTMHFERNWQTGTTIKLSELSTRVDESTTSFQMVRDAGTFYFEGQFDEYRGDLLGEGRCRFRPNGDYTKKMRDYGVTLEKPRDVLSFAIHNITLAYAQGMADAGYNNLGRDKLVEAHIHDVTPEYIGELDQLGYRKLPISRLVEMQIHDVDAEFIEELADLGYKDLTVDQLVQFSIHDVEPDFIREMAALGYKDLSPSRLVELQIHDVDAKSVRQYHELGHDHLSTDDLVQMHIHDVTPEYIRGWAELGYDDLSTDRLVQLHIHDVDPEDVEEYGKLGYKSLSTDELVQMSIHDVSPRYIRGWKELGYRDLSTDRLVQLQIHDVDPEDVEAYADLGYKDLSPDELVQMSIHDVTPSFIKELAELGYDDLSVDRLIEFSIHDVTPAYIKRLAKQGERNLSPRELVERKIYGR